ncbi:MAG: nicotinate phosphoribosyltransferase [bacterium]
MEFHIATSQQIKDGKVTDVYFQRTVEILKEKNIDKKVTAEIRATDLPLDWNWAVLCGIEEIAYLLQDKPVQIRCMREGTIFKAGEPVLEIAGNYTDFAILETALLGLLCQASGVATKASRCRIAAENKTVLSFGARRMHPALAPMIDRAAFIGGCDGVAVIQSAEMIGITPKGTMPHALILIVGDPVEAFLLFHEVEPIDVPRIALVDTFGDEKFEAIKAAEALGHNLSAVRIDTPNSRRGNFKKILEEVRWELNIRGFKDVKIFVSGGLDEHSILQLNEVADGYGVGTSLSNAPVVNFAMDIVEIEGNPIAKRGKLSGSKNVLQCPDCHQRKVVPKDTELEKCPLCKKKYESLLDTLIKDGKVVADIPSPKKIRDYVLIQIKDFELKL